MSLKSAKDYKWVCVICGERFKTEVDLLAHQFNSPCERELNEPRAADKPPDLRRTGDDMWTVGKL
jgi:hypothetical protein